MRRFTTIILLSIFSLWCLHGLGVQAQAKDINTLNVGWYHARISTLDPHVQNATERYICYMTCEPLIGRHRDTLKRIPKLATSWEISPDAKVFTFHLRKGVKFHDGTVFDADAVKFTFDRISYLKKGFYWMLKWLEDVQVVDKYTIRFVLNETFAPFISVVEYFPIVSPKSVLENEEVKGDYAKKWYIDHGVGTGPYRFVKWEHGVKVVHEKYDEYWGGWKGKHVNKVVHWLIPEAGTQRMMLEKGELDVIQTFTPDDFVAYKKGKHPEITVAEKDSMAPMYIRLNCAAPPTNNVKVRQALSYCFNRGLFAEMMPGGVQMSDGPCPKELLGGWRPENVIMEYNPEKAKKLLAEAGYPNGFEMDVLVQKGTQRTQTIAEIWQTGLVKAGVKLNIRPLPWPAIATQLHKWAVDRDPATATAAYVQWISPRLPDPYSYLYLAYHSDAQTGKGRNWMLYSNPQVDEMSEKAVKMVDEEERMKIYKKAVQIVANDCPDVFVEKVIDQVILRKVVANFYFDALYVKTVPYYDVYKTAP